MDHKGVYGKSSLYFGSKNYTTYIGNVSWNQNPLSIDMNGDGQINRTEVRAITIKGNILDFGLAEESDGGNFSYNSGIYMWDNQGKAISSTTESNLTFLTKRRTLGMLPIVDQIVTISFEAFPLNTLNITTVEGRHFTLLPPQDHQRTAYGFLFALYPDEGNTNFRSSYLRRY